MSSETPYPLHVAEPLHWGLVIAQGMEYHCDRKLSAPSFRHI